MHMAFFIAREKISFSVILREVKNLVPKRNTHNKFINIKFIFPIAGKI